MDLKRSKIFGANRPKISKTNSEFEFDDIISDNRKSELTPVPTSFWSDKYKKPTRPVHTFCEDNRKRKLPLKDHMNKIPKINHLDEICNRASRAKITNKDKGKIKTKTTIGNVRSSFDFGMGDDDDNNIIGFRNKIPSKRPLKAESPSKHRKLVSSSFDFPSEEKEMEIKEKTQHILRPGPKKAKLNMKAIKCANTNGGRFGGIFDIPEPDAEEEDSEENVSPDGVIEIEPVIDLDTTDPEEEQNTMVSNVKDSGNCIRDGESQKFFDEFDYLFDGMRKAEPLAVRSLSTYKVAQNCFNKEFRDNIRRNNLLKTIYKELVDAHTDPSLSLCTAAFMYVISIDDKHFDFPKQAIEILLSILKTEEVSLAKKRFYAPPKPSKSLTNFRKKISELFRKELSTIVFVDLDRLTACDLVHEVLIFLTAPTAEVDFREFIRTMGGIDFFIINTETLIKQIDKAQKLSSENCLKFNKIERCLQMLENLTYMNSDNQNYALNCRSKLIVRCVHNILNIAHTIILSSQSNKIKLLTKSQNITAVFDCVIATMRMMLNLTHSNEYSCKEIGKYNGLIRIIMENILFLPKLASEKHKLDCYTLGLGLLINIMGEVPENRTILIKCSFESSQWLTLAEDDILNFGKTPIHLLVATFLKFHASSNELEKQTFSEAENLCLQEGQETTEIELDIEPGLEKPRDSNSACTAAKVDKDTNGEDPFGFKESTPKGNTMNAKDKSTDAKSTKVKQVVDNMIAKAGEHMEESMIGSYLALLLGILTKDEDNLELIKELIPEPKTLIDVLKKFLQFMNMMSLTSAAASKSGMQQIRSIVHWLSAVL